MKLIFLIIFITSVFGFAQDTNKIVIDESSEKPMLVGHTTREAFADTNFSWWFNSEYEFYEPDTTTIDNFTEKFILTDVTIIMGTWCSDSRREVPRFFKILDYIDFPEEQLTMISVDRSKQMELIGEEPAPEIELVPTFIFYSHGVEIGRIEEAPEETLEKSISEILQML